MTRFQKLLPWLIGVLIATLLMGTLALTVGLQYTGNDDAPLLRSTMGYEGGAPATWHLHMHAAFTWLLYGMAKLFPGVVWFSLLQLFLLWLSQVVIVKSLCQLARQKGLPMAAGAAAGAVFLGAFALFFSSRITYTVTAAFCGAAAVLWLASVDFSSGRRQIMRGVFGSAALLIACYFLRMSAVLPSACFWLLVFGIKFLSRRSKHALRALLIVLLVFAVSIGGLLLNIELQGARQDAAWHDSRIALFDYTGFLQPVPDETLHQIGWSRDELTLVENWFFLNDNITADAFQTLKDQQIAAAQPAPGVFDKAWTAVSGAFSDSKLRAASWALLLFACAAALRGNRRTWLLLALALLGGAAMLFILGAMGRLNLRAAYTILLPAGAAVFAAFFGADGGRKPRWALAVLITALVAGTAFAAVAGVRQLNDTYIPPNPYFTDTTSDLHADLDEIALMNEDMLIVYDLSLSHDHRLFPNTAEGIPKNLMLWGGWQSHTPSWRRQLAEFGITALDASLFLRDNVLFASTYDQPPAELMRYVAAASDTPVDWTYYEQWGYVNLFAFAPD